MGWVDGVGWMNGWMGDGWRDIYDGWRGWVDGCG